MLYYIRLILSSFGETSFPVIGSHGSSFALLIYVSISFLVFVCTIRFFFLSFVFLGRFWHFGRMVMIDQPLAVFPNINEGVSAANFVPGSSHGEFVQANIGAPTGSDRNVALQNSARGLTLQKVLKVVPDGIVIGSGDVGNGWQQNGTGGRIPSRNGVWIFGTERVVPQME